MKTKISIAVTIKGTGDQELTLEPGTKDVIVLTGSAGLKIGVNGEDLLKAITELRALKEKHLPPAPVEEPKPDAAIEGGMILTYGDEE